MDWRTRITADPAVCHGKPCVRGTRVLVSALLDDLADGAPAESVAKAYGVSLDDVRAALAYASDLARDNVVRLPGAA